MRTLAAAAVVAAACVSPFTTSGAHAAYPVAGMNCEWSVMSDLRDPYNTIAEIDGGPIAAADLSDVVANPVTVEIECAFQVNGLHYTDPDVGSTRGSGVGVAYAPPTFVEFSGSALDWYTVCETVTITDAHGDVTTLYLDDATDDWSTDPATASCAGAGAQDLPPWHVCRAVWPACQVAPPPDRNSEVAGTPLPIGPLSGSSRLW